MVVQSDMPERDVEIILEMSRPESSSLKPNESEPSNNNSERPKLAPFPKTPIVASNPEVEIPSVPLSQPPSTGTNGSLVKDKSSVPGDHVRLISAENGFRCEKCEKFVDVEYVLHDAKVVPVCTHCFMDYLERENAQFTDAEDPDDMDELLAEAIGDCEEEDPDFNTTN
jgi:hypothetical protein